MKQPIVHNQNLLRHLFEKYYQGQLAPREMEFVSSHWRYESQFLQVRDAGEEGIIPVHGSYWGCHWNGLRARLLDHLCILSHLVVLSHKIRLLRYRAVAAKVCSEMGLDATFTVFRQVCCVDLIERHLSDELRSKRMHVLMIGDGIGVLSGLFKAVFPRSTVVMVDIGKTLLYQAYYAQKAHPKAIHKLANDVTDLDGVDFVYCPTEDLDVLEKLKFDLAVNSLSMQEMNIATIERYFAFLRRRLDRNNFFYCCNRERKVMPGGEVSEFFNYPWQDGDRFLIDGDCPWQRFYFARHRSKNGPSLFGFRIPLVNFYDGRIVHRLAVLETT